MHRVFLHTDQFGMAELCFIAAPALLELCCCLLPRTAYRGCIPHAEASWPLQEGDIVYAHIGPKMENWALGKVAAVAADGSVAVSFTDASFCSCLPEIGEVEPARDPCCGGGGRAGWRAPLRALPWTGCARRGAAPSKGLPHRSPRRPCPAPQAPYWTRSRLRGPRRAWWCASRPEGTSGALYPKELVHPPLSPYP